MTEPAAGRSSSFGEGGDVTVVDRFGVWLSKRQIEKAVELLNRNGVNSDYIYVS